MAFGTGPESLVSLLTESWAQSRTGRDDVPPMYDPNQSIDTQKNVVVPLRNRERSGVDRGIHDILHCYHPEGGPFTVTDAGFKEQNVVETVQIDIELTDRTNHDTGERLFAEDRMVSERGSLADLDEPPYPGILGETKYILESVRRGLDEYDKVSHEIVNTYLGNSNANVSFSVELERLAANTVPQQ